LPDESRGESPRLGPAELDHLREALRTMALGRLGDVDAAEDVAQETLLRVLATLAQAGLQDPAALYGFVWTVARNVIWDMGRRREREARLGAGGGRLDAPRAADDPLTGLVSAEEASRVRAALDRLSDSDRELLRLCYCDGLSPGEVAARMGEPAPRLRKRKSRALERLRAAFLQPSPAASTKARPLTRVGPLPVADVGGAT